MYQCSASNVYGTRLSSAQLRVLAFAPNFSKRPLDPSQMATTGGNATITCQPEASPRPEVSWSHNGVLLEIAREISGRIILLGNGNLLITQVQMSDQGEYKCTATNSEGSASSSGLLLVVEQATITVHPDDTYVMVNNTAFMSCEASYNRLHHELVYIWHLNDHIIDINNDPHFKLASRDGIQGIYIINAQFQHEGRYECRAVTVKDSARASAYLTVQGPPSEPAGVFGQVIDRSIHLSWTDGTSHASAINSYIIELKSNFNPRWRLALSDLDNAELVDVQYPSRRKQVISDLSPGSSYSFRVRAVNSYGIGPASVQSPFYKVPDAPPTRAPDGIVNIFSSVGMLAFTWNVLDPEYLTGQNIGYQVYWRKKEEGKDRHWETDRVLGQDNSYKALVGSDNYFLEYEVMVAAFNSLGHGPNSSITIIMSAEDLPIATPRNVWGEDHNSSALNVYWDPIENTREMIRGKIIGYQITWWWESEPLLTYWSRHHCDDCGHAVVLVPHPKDNYWVYVQVFNSAGFGPKGEIAFATTFLSPPQLYPEYVSINSHSNNSVYVSWRGVPIGGLEEALNGYKLWWWPATENMNTALITVVNKRLQTWAVLEGIKKDIVYAVRVMGFSRGGDGKKSPTVYFTLGGQVVYNSITTDILAAGICTTASFGMLLFFALTHVLVYLMYC